MTAAYEHSIEHTAQLPYEWIVDLDKLLNWSDPQRAYRLLRHMLQALRDQLDVEAAQLSAQLPTLMRGLFSEGWRPSRSTVHERNRQAFLAHIEKGFSNDPLEASEGAVCKVFRLLRSRVSAGEVTDVRMRLPKALREFWPEVAA